MSETQYSVEVGFEEGCEYFGHSLDRCHAEKVFREMCGKPGVVDVTLLAARGDDSAIELERWVRK